MQHSDDEDDDYSNSHRHHQNGGGIEDRDGLVKSPELFYEEDVEHFLENFHRQKPSPKHQTPRTAKLSQKQQQNGGSASGRGSPLSLNELRRSGLQTVNTKPRLRSASDFSDSFLSESNSITKRMDSISSEGVYLFPFFVFKMNLFAYL